MKTADAYAVMKACAIGLDEQTNDAQTSELLTFYAVAATMLQTNAISEGFHGAKMPIPNWVAALIPAQEQVGERQ